MNTGIKVIIAFAIVILIWATTPLAIKWSGEGPGFLFGVTARMMLGVTIMLIIAWIKRVPLPGHRRAWLTYFAAGLGIYGAMLATYWSAQYIQSGFISVLFGLTPIATGVLAYFMLSERDISFFKLTGIVLGLVGLLVIFWRSVQVGQTVMYGILAMCVAVLIHALSSVLVKRWHTDMPSMSVTTGGMLVATPAYLATWLLIDGQWPQSLPVHAVWSILYLAVIATTIGFNFYYYILKHMPASRVALLTLLTPVLSLWIGNVFNGEVISQGAVLGTMLILAGMSLYQWGALWVQRFRARYRVENQMPDI